MVELVTERHIRSLLKLKTTEDQMKILRAIYENDLNVRETEELIADFLAGRFTVSQEEGEKTREEFSRKSFLKPIRPIDCPEICESIIIQLNLQ